MLQDVRKPRGMWQPACREVPGPDHCLAASKVGRHVWQAAIHPGPRLLVDPLQAVLGMHWEDAPMDKQSGPYLQRHWVPSQKSSCHNPCTATHSFSKTYKGVDILAVLQRLEA